jgi:hypothetical protein
LTGKAASAATASEKARLAQKSRAAKARAHGTRDDEHDRVVTISMMAMEAVSAANASRMAAANDIERTSGRRVSA